MEQTSALQKWSLVRSLGGSTVINALNKFWYQKQTLTPDEKNLLKSIFKQYPFGQSDFNIWLKQTLRQIFENSVDEQIKK